MRPLGGRQPRLPHFHLVFHLPVEPGDFTFEKSNSETKLRRQSGKRPGGSLGPHLSKSVVPPPPACGPGHHHRASGRADRRDRCRQSAARRLAMHLAGLCCTCGSQEIVLVRQVAPLRLRQAASWSIAASRLRPAGPPPGSTSRPVRGLSRVIGVGHAAGPPRTRRAMVVLAVRAQTATLTPPLCPGDRAKAKHNQCRGQSCGHRPSRALACRRAVTCRAQNTRQGTRSPSTAL